MQKQKHRCLLVTNAQICCVFDDKILHLKHNLPETAMKNKRQQAGAGPLNNNRNHRYCIINRTNRTAVASPDLYLVDCYEPAAAIQTH